MDLFNTVTSNGCREMTEARFNEALNEYRQTIITLVDEMIKENDGFSEDYEGGYADACKELKQKIETL